MSTTLKLGYILALLTVAGCKRPPPIETAQGIPQEAAQKAETPLDEDSRSARALTEGSSCEGAMEQIKAFKPLVSKSCNQRSDCGLVELSYDLCDGPESVNIAESTVETRTQNLALLQRARELCGYVHAPCPAPVVGEAICVSNRCDATFRLLGRLPTIRLQIKDSAGPIRLADIGVTLRSGSPLGDMMHTVKSDDDGWIELPTSWLGVPQLSITIGHGRKLKQYNSLADFLEASGAPVMFEASP
jgi:hypothetical protein